MDGWVDEVKIVVMDGWVDEVKIDGWMDGLMRLR